MLGSLSLAICMFFCFVLFFFFFAVLHLGTLSSEAKYSHKRGIMKDDYEGLLEVI